MAKKKKLGTQSSHAKLKAAYKSLQIELQEATDVLRAIQNSEVDALVINGEYGEKIFTLENADRPYRTLVETMNEGAAMLGQDGTIFYCNRRLAEVLGMTLESLLGSKIADLIFSPERENFLRFFQLAKQERASDTFLFRAQGGGSVPLLISTNPAEIDGNKGLCIIATDLTQQIRFKEYETLARELEQAVQARDEFISIASHELKTPLTTLRLQSQLQKRLIMKKDPRAYDEAHIAKMIDQTEGLTGRLNRLVEDMLDIARIKSGNLSIHKEQVDLCQIAQDVLERMQGQFITCGSGIPSFHATRAEGQWDPMRLEQVIGNLMVNAIKYGEGRPVEVGIKTNGLQVVFSVKDQGMGISQENQSKIFGRFERAVSANEISGLGLGLFISQQIIEAHQGRFWVESEIGRGSTFSFELPMKPASNS